MRSEVQVLLDPPSTGIRGLSSVGRAPALQAGCHRFESVRLHHSLRFDQKAQSVLSRPIGRSVHGTHLTSFREIIGVIGRNQVGLWCQYDPSGSERNNDVVQVKYTNQMFSSCMGIGQKVFSRWKRRETYMLLTGSEPLRHAKGRNGRQTFGSFFFRIKSSAIRAFGGCLGSKRR